MKKFTQEEGKEVIDYLSDSGYYHEPGVLYDGYVFYEQDQVTYHNYDRMRFDLSYEWDMVIVCSPITPGKVAIKIFKI